MSLLADIENPSNEQKRYVAAVCPEFESHVEQVLNNDTVENEVNYDECNHWDDGNCNVFDGILTSIDQT